MAILAMVCSLVFPANSRRDGFEIRRIHSCTATSGWDMLTDNATIELPRNVKGLKRDGLKNWIRRGDEVIINLGYNKEYNEEFVGFVSDVDANIPIKITCEDMMWKLKQVGAKYSASKCNVRTMLNDIVPKDLGITIDAQDMEIGAFKTDKGVTVAQVLQKLKDIGVYTYFKGKTLVAGKIYTDDDKEVVYNFQDNIIANQLKYRVADDILIKVTATSTKKNGKKLSVSVGDEDGQEQKLSYYGIDSEAKLKELAEKDLERLKVDGYSGSMDTFGNPYVKHGYKAKLTNNDYPEQSGRYYVDSMKFSFNASGFKRTLDIGGVA
jgi:hypothetical protein